MKLRRAGSGEGVASSPSTTGMMMGWRRAWWATIRARNDEVSQKRKGGRDERREER